MYNFRAPFFMQPAFSNVNNSYKKNYYNTMNFPKKTNMPYSNKEEPYFNSNKCVNESEKAEQKGINKIFQIDTNEVLFEIFGLKIYFDDVLIICILLFLYQEGIQDEYLFISLILLLLS